MRCNINIKIAPKINVIAMHAIRIFTDKSKNFSTSSEI